MRSLRLLYHAISAKQSVFGQPTALKTCLSYCAVCIFLTQAASANTLSEHMDIKCEQTNSLALRCHYRLVDPQSLISAIAELDGQVIEGKLTLPYPQDGDTSSILILVDTSDPARAVALAKNVEHVNSFIAKIKPHHNLGLARFDAELEMLAPITNDRDSVAMMAATLSATGRTTELYRNVIVALDHLAQTQASRRLLILMSDGLAEDHAYGHDDVIATARKHSIVISSIGYPRSVAQSVALQTIRRLSEETGGLYVQATHTDFSLPANFFERVLSAFDSGGMLSFSLEKFTEQGLNGALELSLGFQTNEQSFLAIVGINLPSETPTIEQALTIDPPGDAIFAVDGAIREPRPPSTPPPKISAAPSWVWFGVPSTILLLVVSALTLYLFLTRKKNVVELEQPIAMTHVEYAFFVMPHDETRRFVISHTPWRIGRSRNNDLSLDDHSISRVHAEVRRNDNGEFVLHDMDSLNGVFISGQRITKTTLREGDDVEIGDVPLKFTLHDAQYEVEAVTVLSATKTPH